VLLLLLLGTALLLLLLLRLGTALLSPVAAPAMLGSKLQWMQNLVVLWLGEELHS
jgi:hypothetical protein